MKKHLFVLLGNSVAGPWFFLTYSLLKHLDLTTVLYSDPEAFTVVDIATNYDFSNLSSRLALKLQPRPLVELPKIGLGSSRIHFCFPLDLANVFVDYG